MNEFIKFPTSGCGFNVNGGLIITDREVENPPQKMEHNALMTVTAKAAVSLDS